MKRIHLTLDDQEALNLEVLRSKYGGSIQIQIRRLIQNAFEKEFGGYKAEVKVKPIKEPEPELTDEQFCEQKGGKVMRDKGIMVCRIPTNVGHWQSVIGDVKENYKNNF